MEEKLSLTTLMDIIGVLFALLFIAAFGYIFIRDQILEIPALTYGTSALLLIPGILTVFTFGMRGMISQKRDELDYQKISRKYFFTWLFMTILLLYICLFAIVFPLPFM